MTAQMPDGQPDFAPGNPADQRFREVGRRTYGREVFTYNVVGRLTLALDAGSGKVLKEIELGPVWSGPAVLRGRVYVGTGNVLFSSPGPLSLIPHEPNGAVVSFGLPGEDEVSKMAGKQKE